MRTIVDRIEEVLCEIHSGSEDARRFSAMERATKALAWIRDIITLHPDDYDQYITNLYLHEEIGYFMMEEPNFCQTDLGHKILVIRNDLGNKLLIQSAVKATERAARVDPNDAILRTVTSLLIAMNDSFDEDLHQDRHRLWQLGQELTRMIDHEAAYLYQGNLRESLGDALIIIPSKDV